MKVVGAVALAALVLAGASASAAERAFPGRNGLIVFVSDRTSPMQAEIYAVAVDGSGRRNLTRTSEPDSTPRTSPDGTRILFESAHEGTSGIFVMNADGSGRHFLTGGENPVWAPDSRRIAFENCCGWLAVLDLETGEARMLKQGRLAAWSPDGRTIAFHGFGRGSPLHVVGADGSGERQLASGLALTLFGSERPAWSPDGTQIAFVGGAADQNGMASTSDVYIARVDGGGAALLVGGGEKSAPRWSPDGRTIVYADAERTGPGIFLVDANGGAPSRLTRPALRTFDSEPAWSPDGTWIAFGRGPRPDDATDAMVLRADGTGVRRLTPARFDLPPNEGPVWAGDGRTVVYAGASSDRDPDLFTTQPDGSGLRRLTNNLVEDREPSWSPDGSRIAFVRTLRGRSTINDEIYVMRADGTGVRRLTSRAYEDLSPSWSPDGSRIVFVRRVQRTGLLAVYTMRSQGGGVRRLTERAGFYSSPAWSPDGQRIVFTGGNGVGEGGDLYVVGARGGRVRRLPDVAEISIGPRWSPDGRSLALIGATPCGGSCVTTAVYVVGADGRGARKVSEAGGVGVAWSPDGSEILVGRGVIEAIAADGSVRPVTDPGADDRTPDWQPRCTLSGSPRADRLRGGAGDDLVCGRGGADRLTGGRGRDGLFGAEGNDAIDARGGAFDVVGCGPGRDTVAADRRDLVGEDCERVSRS